MDDARLFLCARCRRQVLICSVCDRGQQYCGARCSDLGPKRITARGGASISAIATRPALSCRAPAPLPASTPRRGLPRESDASGFRSVAMRCSTGAPTSSQARGEPFDVPQAGHQASSRSERHFHDAVPFLRTPDQRVRASSLATLADSPASSTRRTALNAQHDGDQRRTQGADPAIPLCRTLAGGHHRLAAPHPSLHRRAGAERGGGGARLLFLALSRGIPTAIRRFVP